MMKFRIAKLALLKLLGDAAGGRYRVIGYQKQSKSAHADHKLVQVYYSEGTFPKNAGRYHGEKAHDITLEIDLTVSAHADADIATLQSETATAVQRAAALAGVKFAAENADTELDELIDVIYQIVMDARNDGLGLDKGVIASRWIDRIQKDTTIEHGGLVVKTASMKYTCRVSEDMPGDIGNEPTNVIIDSQIPVDECTGAGVETVNDNLEVE